MRLAWIALAAATAFAQDAPKRHSEKVTTARHEFKVRLGGSVDGESTRDPVVYNAWKQGFEPMRRVRLENLGATDVVNPWILVNGKRNWRTAKDIADEAVSAYGDPKSMTDGEKVRAIWDFQRKHRFHATTGDLEVRDPVKMFNVYGYSLCGDNAPVLADLWRTQGFQTRRGFPLGHCVSEVWYDKAWHMLDADESVLFLERDNKTVASENAVARDHDLARRGYKGDVLPALYSYDGPHSGDYPSHAEHTMRMTLRPGEAIEWRWDKAEKHHRGTLPSIYTLNSTELKRWGENAWAALANGKWSYTPRLGPGNKFTWKMEAPYVIVGGNIRARVRGGCAFRFSFDNEHWKDISPGSLDAFFPSAGPAVYRYFVQAELHPGAALEAITIENDLQMARLSMPALELGDNRITYFDETAGPRSVRLTLDWVERSGITPPPAPASPDQPADAAEVEGTKVAFRWKAVAGAKEYWFQLGSDPNLRWALTPAFETVVTGRTDFTLERDGMLNPGQRYYWRVRARSEEGVWGPWSMPWSFTPHGPGTPLNVRLEQDRPDGFTLRWEANPEGRKPLSFRIYASDEKGFPVNDEPYRAFTGNQTTRGLFPGEKSRVFPTNLLTTVQSAQFELLPQHAFYRVVAVDEKGIRSGPSDYASAPRPFVYSRPPVTGKVGEPFRYEVKTIKSIGDVTFRDFGPGQSYQSAFWEADKPLFSIEYEMPRCGNFDPKWLRLDESGVMRGTPGPSDAGEYQVNVKVEIPGAGRYIQSFPLRINK